MIQLGEEIIKPRKIGRLELVDRETFMEKVSSRGVVERLVRKRKLTPYYENGSPKKPKNGRYDSKKTYYDFNEYKNIEFSEI